MPSMYNPQYSTQGPQYFYQQPCNQAIPPAQLPGYPEANNELDLGSFSRGSSQQYNDHACHLPGTVGPSTGPPSILTNAHATGPVITGSPADVLGHSQPIQNSQLSWRLHPAQAYTQTTTIPFRPNASTSNCNKRTSGSHADSNPMAVLLPPEGTSPSLLLPLAPNTEAMSRQSAALLSAFALDMEAPGQNTTNRVPREKKHACWMCHKSFDRPSTLRKHLLVHTGEKAFVCETCGRRFGVASNLNRHVRRCILRPVNTANTPQKTSSNDSSAAQAISPTAIPASSGPTDPSAPCQPAIPLTNGEAESMNASKRRNKQSQPQSQSDPSPGTTQKTFKRRRRAPSPSRWIPFSLLAFDLSPIELHKSTPVPLPPVTPSSVRTVWSEERNSWDENVGVAPYDRYEYKGTLPGPGLGLGSGTGFGGRDVGNLGGAGSFIMGRLVLA